MEQQTREQIADWDCWPQNKKCKIDILFYVIDVGLGLASARIKYLAFDFIEIVFILLMIEYISVLDNSHRHTIINYDDTQHGRSKA